MDVDGWVVVECMRLPAASHSLFICLLATPVSVKLGKKKKEAETQLRLTRIREQSVSANTDSSSQILCTHPAIYPADLIQYVVQYFILE